LNIARRIREVSRLSGEFVLRSGAVADTYFDKYQFESDPVLLKAIAQELAELVPSGTEILAGLELGGIPVVTALSSATGIPAAFLRKQRKEHGTKRYAEGPDLGGRNVVLVEDVVSSGGQILETLAMLNVDGIAPTVALCVIDRESGGREALQARGLELRALFTMSEIEDA
jgi:orotate phosphoribosyltransferase